MNGKPLRRSKSRTQRRRTPAKLARIRPFVEQLEERILMSVAPEPYVTALYRDLLGRAPEPGGLAYWVGRLQEGAGSAAVVHDMMGSPEFCTRLVQEEYDAFFHR